MVTAIAKRTDSAVKDDVLRELKWDTRVDETEVGVQVKNGVVTLTGMVSNYAKRIAAAEAAHRVFGVQDVANDLTVKPLAPTARTDSELAQAVRQALKWDVLVPEAKIQTTVSNGWVTLDGEVMRWTERIDAEKAVAGLVGVTGITNKLMIVAPKIDAKAVHHDIEEALERHAAHEAKRVTVSVKDGTVTLSGCVSSWAERNAVEQVASHAPGVKRLESTLTVDPLH